MKKRLLLASLPALLILSACNGGAQKKEDNNIFLEDSLAHDEIFDNRNFEDRELMPRRADPVVHPDSDVSIGIQCFEDGGNVNLRFVAAVSFAEGQLTPTDAVWTRSVYSPDGVKYSTKFDAGEYACTTAYKKISNGGSAYSISDFNTDHKTSYTHFVVYTLRNIPKATYSSYYVSAYLTLSPNSEGGIAETKTKAIAVRVDGSEKYTYDPFVGEYFMVGSWSASPIPATTVREGGNKASFEEKNLSAGDSFVIKEFYNTKLEVHGYSTKCGDVSDYYLNDSSNNFVAKYNGLYNFYLKYVEDSPGVGHNEVYTKAKVYSRKYYVDLSSVTWWTSESAKAELYVYKDAQGGNPKVEEFIELQKVGATNIWETPDNVNLNRYAYGIVARRNPSNTNEWWNQTPNISLNDYDDGFIKNCIKVKDSTLEEHPKKDYEWQYHAE